MPTIITRKYSFNHDPEERIRKDKENFKEKIKNCNKEELKELLHKFKKEILEKEKEILSSQTLCEIESLTLKIQVINDLLEEKENS